MIKVTVRLLITTSEVSPVQGATIYINRYIEDFGKKIKFSKKTVVETRW